MLTEQNRNEQQQQYVTVEESATARGLRIHIQIAREQYARYNEQIEALGCLHNQVRSTNYGIANTYLQYTVTGFIKEERDTLLEVAEVANRQILTLSGLLYQEECGI